MSRRHDRDGASAGLARPQIAHHRLLTRSPDERPPQEMTAWKARACDQLGVELLFDVDDAVPATSTLAVASLMVSHGGEVEAADDTWQLIPIFDDSDKTRVKRTCNDIVRETKLAREWPRFPANAVAIGDNGTGDKLLFLPDDSTDRLAGVVYGWDHETGELTALADDFAALAGG